LSHQNEPPPVFRAPPLSCDAHFHIFGPGERYPYGTGTNENLRYAPPLAPLSDYLELARVLGMERFVFVQPSAYGRDNARMLDAMREVGVARCRGIVDVDENAPDTLLAEMDKLGVRGVRINVSPVKPLAPGFSASMRPRIERLEARCARWAGSSTFSIPAG
jgi:2-pyrone-4,6-dicarboxylate lactonase